MKNVFYTLFPLHYSQFPYSSATHFYTRILSQVLVSTVCVKLGAANIFDFMVLTGNQSQDHDVSDQVPYPLVFQTLWLFSCVQLKDSYIL